MPAGFGRGKEKDVYTIKITQGGENEVFLDQTLSLPPRYESREGKWEHCSGEL